VTSPPWSSPNKNLKKAEEKSTSEGAVTSTSAVISLGGRRKNKREVRGDRDHLQEIRQKENPRPQNQKIIKAEGRRTGA